jgi:phosphonoacetaldehyde hydrolase
MFADFVPLQLACLAEHAEPIAGCLETIEALRSRGMKIGSTTGFTHEMMDVLLPEAKRRGYAPDVTIAANDVPQGRPYPYMCLRNVIDLGVSSVEACVKVDDTVAGIEEGRNAGMWTVGVVMTGNEIGLPAHELARLSQAEREDLRARGAAHLLAAGAHHVIDGIADLPALMSVIEARLGAGAHP